MDLRIRDMEGWALLASGEGRKLERFGEILIERPSPQAIWPLAGECRFDEAAAVFHRKKDGSGDWVKKRRLPEGWPMDFMGMRFEIRLTGFGNVGIFPEHAVHWDWMAERLDGVSSPTVLNLFGYTGGASVALAKRGVSVTHVDAAKSVNGWAIGNAVLSGVEKSKLRFLADDAVKFVRREIRRGNRYHGIILDPPSFGRGTKGEVWKIERDFSELMSGVKALLAPRPAFVLTTSHSPGVTPAVLRALLTEFGGEVTSGEMLLSGKGPELPAGAFARWIP